jgi:hypothetical protein
MIVRSEKEILTILEQLPENKRGALDYMSLKMTSWGWVLINILFMCLGLIFAKYHGYAMACILAQCGCIFLQLYQVFYLHPQTLKN